MSFNHACNCNASLPVCPSATAVHFLELFNNDNDTTTNNNQQRRRILPDPRPARNGAGTRQRQCMRLTEGFLLLAGGLSPSALVPAPPLEALALRLLSMVAGGVDAYPDAWGCDASTRNRWVLRDYLDRCRFDWTKCRGVSGRCKRG